SPTSSPRPTFRPPRGPFLRAASRRLRCARRPLRPGRRTIRRPRFSASFPRRAVEMSVAIVDYGSGNLHSAHKAFERAAREAGLNAEIKVTGDPEDVRRAGHIVLPGVGAFADCR